MLEVAPTAACGRAGGSWPATRVMARRRDDHSRVPSAAWRRAWGPREDGTGTHGCLAVKEGLPGRVRVPGPSPGLSTALSPGSSLRVWSGGLCRGRQTGSQKTLFIQQGPVGTLVSFFSALRRLLQPSCS